MGKNSLIVIGFVFSINVTGMESQPSISEVKSSWEIIGNFSNIVSYGYDVPLNRQFRIASNEANSTIKEISVLGYKNNEIIIQVSLRKKMADVEKILLERNLMAPQTFDWDKDIWSCDTTKLQDFLTVFVDNNLLDRKIKDTILYKIAHENP